MGEDFNGWTLGWLAETLGGELRGPAEFVVRRPISASTRDPEGIAFAESEAYVRSAIEAGVGALIVDCGVDSGPVPSIAVSAPRIAFAKLLAMAEKPMPIASGVHPTAVVDPSAEVDPSASVGACAVVERGVRIGKGARVYAFAYIGEGCVVGEDATVYPHATLYRDVTLGARAIVHAGSVIGADGFGFVWDGAAHRKVPQVGSVDIGADAEIGALTAVDRATAGETAIGRGTKVDNLVQIAHNVKIGEDCAIAGQTGIAGSATLGDRVTMGGQVAVSDHVSISGDTTFGGRSAVGDDIAEPGVYWGYPARPVMQALRAAALAAKLPDLLSRIRRIERKLDERGDD